VERYLRNRKDPYKLDRNRGDGEGQKLTTPGSAGMLGDSPDAAVGFGGSNERDGYPDGISMYQEKENRPRLPKDTDPDDPFTGDSDKNQYGQGQDTNLGQALHDDANVNAGDSALGMHETVERNLGGNNLDRKTDVSNMSSRSRNEPRARLTYNRFQQSVGPMDLVRNRNSK
jgi:hypothetical protein